MPNWVKNIVTVDGSKQTIKDVIHAVKTPDNVFSLDAVIPAPKFLVSFSFEDSKRFTGHTDVEWCNRHWGTRRDTEQAELVNGNTFVFLTAWTTPIPVFKELSTLFPNATFTIKYASEDVYENNGMYVYTNGAVDDFKMYEGGSNEAQDFFTTIWSV